jgi:carbon-monoxide dehydrogenase small subunit
MAENEFFTLHVNGSDHQVADVWIGESLLYVLRERLGLLGSKGACEEGECGSCSVLVDDELLCSCLVLAASAVGRAIITIEGVAGHGAPSDVQRAFVECGAVQCGFCTPGLIMATHALLDETPHPSDTEIREALSGNICRCTGYGRIIQP